MISFAQSNCQLLFDYWNISNCLVKSKTRLYFVARIKWMSSIGCLCIVFVRWRLTGFIIVFKENIYFKLWNLIQLSKKSLFPTKRPCYLHCISILDVLRSHLVYKDHINEEVIVYINDIDAQLLIPGCIHTNPSMLNESHSTVAYSGSDLNFVKGNKSFIV